MIIIKYVRISVISCLLLAAHPAHALSLSGLKEKIKTYTQSKKARALGAAALAGAGVAWWWYMTRENNEASDDQENKKGKNYHNPSDVLSIKTGTGKDVSASISSNELLDKKDGDPHKGSKSLAIEPSNEDENHQHQGLGSEQKCSEVAGKKDQSGNDEQEYEEQPCFKNSIDTSEPFVVHREGKRDLFCGHAEVVNKTPVTFFVNTRPYGMDKKIEKLEPYTSVKIEVWDREKILDNGFNSIQIMMCELYDKGAHEINSLDLFSVNKSKKRIKLTWKSEVAIYPGHRISIYPKEVLAHSDHSLSIRSYAVSVYSPRTNKKYDYGTIDSNDVDYDCHHYYHGASEKTFSRTVNNITVKNKTPIPFVAYRSFDKNVKSLIEPNTEATISLDQKKAAMHDLEDFIILQDGRSQGEDKPEYAFPPDYQRTLGAVFELSKESLHRLIRLSPKKLSIRLRNKTDSKLETSIPIFNDRHTLLWASRRSEIPADRAEVFECYSDLVSSHVSTELLPGLYAKIYDFVDGGQYDIVEGEKRPFQFRVVSEPKRHLHFGIQSLKNCAVATIVKNRVDYSTLPPMIKNYINDRCRPGFSE